MFALDAYWLVPEAVDVGMYIECNSVIAGRAEKFPIPFLAIHSTKIDHSDPTMTRNFILFNTSSSCDLANHCRKTYKRNMFLNIFSVIA